MADESPLAAVASRLYGVPLTEFTAARDAESRALKDAGDSALAGRVKRFKKPGAGAHLANLLVRADSELLEQIQDLGGRLRAEQADPDPGRLRALDQERRSLVARSVKAAAAAAEDAGGRATDASLRDVEQTVWAAVVDPGGFATLRAGLLVRPLSPSGFGAVDLTDASALPVELGEVPPLPQRTTARPAKKHLAAVPDPANDAPTPVASAPEPPARADPAAQRARRAALKTARAGVTAAEAELRLAEESAEAASAAMADSQHQLAGLQDELAELRDRIVAVEQSIHDRRSEQTDGKAALRAAEKTRRAAATQVDRARSTLDALSDGPGSDEP